MAARLKLKKVKSHCVSEPIGVVEQKTGGLFLSECLACGPDFLDESTHNRSIFSIFFKEQIKKKADTKRGPFVTEKVKGRVWPHMKRNEEEKQKGLHRCPTFCL